MSRERLAPAVRVQSLQSSRGGPAYSILLLHDDLEGAQRVLPGASDGSELGAPRVPPYRNDPPLRGVPAGECCGAKLEPSGKDL